MDVDDQDIIKMTRKTAITIYPKDLNPTNNKIKLELNDLLIIYRSNSESSSNKESDVEVVGQY